VNCLHEVLLDDASTGGEKEANESIRPWCLLLGGILNNLMQLILSD
jgi:hypothetical protein